LIILLVVLYCLAALDQLYITSYAHELSKSMQAHPKAFVVPTNEAVRKHLTRCYLVLDSSDISVTLKAMVWKQ